MNKKFMITAFIVIGFVIASTIIGIWSWQNTDYRNKNRDLDQKILAAKTKVEELQATKDDKNYSPSDLVRNFMLEVRNDSVNVAKLYLSKEKQALDFKTALGFNKELDKITVSDVSQTIENGIATVNIKGTWPTEAQAFEKNFTLIKEDNLWKISEIKGV